MHLLIALMLSFSLLAGFHNAAQAGGTATKELIVNGNFTQGMSGWYPGGNGAPTAVTTGNPNIKFCGINNCWQHFSQNVFIPANALSAHFSFYVKMNTTEVTSTKIYDVFYPTLDGWEPRSMEVSNLSKPVVAGTWTKKDYDLDILAYKGKYLSIGFQGISDYSLPTTFNLDSVSLQVVVPA